MNADELRALRFIALAVVLCVFSISGCSMYRSKLFFEAGYCEATAPGRTSLVWVKCP
jgi:hypothetical protein